MYQFRSLKSLYSVAILYRLPDYTEQKYTCSIVVNARRVKENYLFILEERSGIQLNGEKPQKVVDNLMAQLGNCLYPIELYVNANGELLSVPNFEQIKEIWFKTATELLKQNKTQAFRNYLEAAKENLSDEKSFLKSLNKDSFIHLFFKDYASNSVELSFANFPYQNRKSDFHVRKIPSVRNTYTLFPAFKEAKVQDTGGKMICLKNDPSGEPLRIVVNIYLSTSKSDFYHKKILIEADDNAHEVKTGLFF
ncbi:hypothetical protein FACS1894177_00930 [Bacteroidia bacterium]|nr:hypothetical protein FACS1894177_00930 [Bacteroidia bacterium]